MSLITFVISSFVLLNFKHVNTGDQNDQIVLPSAADQNDQVVQPSTDEIKRAKKRARRMGYLDGKKVQVNEKYLNSIFLSLFKPHK